MSRKMYLYNLHFFDAEDFKNFSIVGYSFCPIAERQPKIELDYGLIFNRGMHLNSYVLIPKRQAGSVFFKGGKSSQHRERKFLDDILLIISILIGRNTVAKFHKKYSCFPLCSSKHCSIIALNSEELLEYLKIAIPLIKDSVWQDKYDSGFHLNMFYNNSNIFVEESGFLANISLWEHLYYRNHKDKSFEDIKNCSLDGKIHFLIKEYFLKDECKIEQNNLRIFSDIRNQLSHNGKLPIQNPKSPFLKLGYAGCEHYVKMFGRLTHVLVLKTLGIDAIGKLHVFGVKAHLDELVKEGFVSHFKEMDCPIKPGAMTGGEKRRGNG
ncbi:MAG: hypothetical protein ABH844_01705 [Candidatus Omnitrophota bacterium]